MKTIGRRLMTYFGLTVLLACLGMGMIAYSSSSQVLEGTAEQVLPVYAYNAASYMENNIHFRLQTLQSVANRYAIRSFDWPTQQQALNEEVRRLGYLNMGFAVTSGELKTTSGSRGNIKDQSGFRQALQGKSIITEPMGDPTPIIMLYTPVRDDSGKIAGVLTASLDGREFSRIIDRISVGPNGYAFMVDSAGTVIAHPDQGMVIKHVNLLRQAAHDETYRDLAGFLRRMLDQQQGVGTYTFMESVQYAAFAPVTGTGWHVMVNAPREDIMGPLADLGKAILYATLGFFVIGLFIAFLAGRQIAAPIRLVSQQYARMASGDFGGSLGREWRRRQDEIGELARGFDQINHSLSRTISELAAGEQRFRMITENMVDLIALIDLDGYFQYVSPSHAHITGWKIREFLGKCVYAAVHPEDVGALQKLLSECAQTRSPGMLTYRFLHADGEYRWLETIAKPLMDGNGQVVSLVTASRDIHERKEAEERMVYMAEHDTLTGLFNRRYFEAQMKRLDENLVVPVALILCDLDGLKFINDTLGHQAGDDLLLASTDILMNTAPEDSIVARIGGDEFGILLPGYNDVLAGIVADSIRTGIQAYNSSHPDILSISIGLAVRINLGPSMSAVFKEADQQMYREKLLHNQSARSAVVDVVMTALEARDFVTEGHTDRLQNVVTTVARRLGLPENRINDLTLFARFHDIGKVGVPDSILFKAGRLTPEEFEEMKKHSEIGYRIAQSSPELIHISDFILKHHEWWDGSGYPLGLKGEDIPLECRIVSVADAYDAMNSDRPYRKALKHQHIIQELRDGAGTQFDPAVIEVFLEILGENH